MNDNLKFKQLSELAENIQKKLHQLSAGELSIKEVEQLTADGRELYERLVVLRFKAYDKEVKGEVSANQVEEEHVSMPAIAFKIEEPKAEVPVQVSLIDAIEEVTKTDFIAEEKSTPAIEELEIPVLDHVSAAENTSVNNSAPNRESLHDRLTKTIVTTESLAQKLEHNPIADLKRAISLNQRFQFSRELFKGNNQDYEVAIDKLNNSSREDALKHLDSLRSKYDWSADSAAASDFVGLVERRHQ
jgi:hypothetical protein